MTSLSGTLCQFDFVDVVELVDIVESPALRVSGTSHQNYPTIH